MTYLDSRGFEKAQATTVPCYIPARIFRNGGWTMSEYPVRWEGNKRHAAFHGVYHHASGVFLHVSRSQLAEILFSGFGVRDKNHCRHFHFEPAAE